MLALTLVTYMFVEEYNRTRILRTQIIQDEPHTLDPHLSPITIPIVWFTSDILYGISPFADGLKSSSPF